MKYLILIPLIAGCSSFNHQKYIHSAAYEWKEVCYRSNPDDAYFCLKKVERDYIQKNRKALFRTYED